MKKLLSLAFIAILLVSCESRSGQLQALQTSPNVRAKVECISTPGGNPTIKVGDVVIRYIDSMYDVGDHIRMLEYEFKVLTIQRPKPAQPEVIVSPSGQEYISTPISLKDYQLEVIEDTILVWDMNRLVGKTFWEDHDKGIGEIIAADIQ